jgi:hypothetical protein
LLDFMRERSPRRQRRYGTEERSLADLHDMKW